MLAVKLHYSVKWSKDLVIFLLSAAHELSAGGMHMYLLVQVGSLLSIIKSKVKGGLYLPCTHGIDGRRIEGIGIAEMQRPRSKDLRACNELHPP